MSLLGPCFLVSGNTVSFSSRDCLLEMVGKSLLRNRLSDQKCSKCFVKTVLRLTGCSVSYCFHIWDHSYIRRSVHFDLHSFKTVFGTLSLCACIESRSSVVPLCEDLSCSLWRSTFYIFYSGKDLFPVVYIDGNFDDEFDEIEGCFKVRCMWGCLGSWLALQSQWDMYTQTTLFHFIYLL